MKICRTLAFLVILAAFPMVLQAGVSPGPLELIRKARKFGNVRGTMKNCPGKSMGPCWLP